MSAVTTRRVTPADLPLIASLHARVFGPGRFARTAYRVREGTAPVSRFCRAAFSGERMIAALRFTEVAVGGSAGGLLLGPLAVDPDFVGQGHGRRLVAEGLAEAKGEGIRFVVLVGDQPYYGRFGFAPVPPGTILLPGPVNPARILTVELEPGALQGVCGSIRPVGRDCGEHRVAPVMAGK